MNLWVTVMWNGINKVITLLGKTFFESNKEYYTLQISESSYVQLKCLLQNQFDTFSILKDKLYLWRDIVIYIEL